MHLSVVFVVCCGWLSAPQPFAAQPTADRQAYGQSEQSRSIRYDENVVVTADRTPDSARDTGSSVSIITGEEIRASGARWLVDVLQWVPGLSVVRSGPPGSLSQVFVRGTDAGHALFLIDGVNVDSPPTGSYDLSGLQAGFGAYIGATVRLPRR